MKKEKYHYFLKCVHKSTIIFLLNLKRILMIVGLRLQLLYMRKNQESIHQLQM